MWSAIRYRRLQALVLLVLAALITSCVVLAPLYYRAMQQALTRSTADAATSSATAIQLRSVSRFTYGADVADFQPTSREDLAALLPPDVRPWFGPGIDGSAVIVTRADQTGRSPVGDLQWRDGACEHVVWVAGVRPAVAGSDRQRHLRPGPAGGRGRPARPHRPAGLRAGGRWTAAVRRGGGSRRPNSAVLTDVQSGPPEIGATIERGRRQALVTVPLLVVMATHDAEAATELDAEIGLDDGVLSWRRTPTAPAWT